MNIITLFNEFTKDFNQNFKENLNCFNLEQKIKTIGDNFTLQLYEQFLNYLDDKYKKSNERKEKYNIKQTRRKTLITSIGTITTNITIYYEKNSKIRFAPLREILKIKPYQRLTNEAEYALVKYAMDENMSKSARCALRNTIVSKSTVSRLIRALDGSIQEEIIKSKNQPNILYIEMDEIHANLQHGGNKICPCSIVHEGYEETFTKRKKLKNIHYFASSKHNYEELWEVIFDYIIKKYDIEKFTVIFVSGDGASGIKNYKNCFPNAKFVLDPFHYKKKHLKRIFKNEIELSNIADEYIRNDLINDFKTLITYQIKKFPEQEKQIKSSMKCILNNIDGIKNQKDKNYLCPCSMEGHINQAYARYITSSPYGFSEKGLENKLKLLTYHANKVELTIEDYFYLKFGTDSYENININIRKLTNPKYDQKLLSNSSSPHIITTIQPLFDTPKQKNKFNELTSISNIKFI